MTLISAANFLNANVLLLLSISSDIFRRPQDFFATISNLLEVEALLSEICCVFLGCQAWSLMTWETMAIFKGLIAPVAGNNHNDEKEYDIHSDTTMNRLRTQKTERTCRSTNNNGSCESWPELGLSMKFTLSSLLPPYLVAYYHYRNSLMDPYKKFIGFYSKSQHMFVNYSLVLDATMSCELQEYGDLTEEECILNLSLYVV